MAIRKNRFSIKLLMNVASFIARLLEKQATRGLQSDLSSGIYQDQISPATLVLAPVLRNLSRHLLL